jgi:stage V sporulation protein G
MNITQVKVFPVSEEKLKAYVSIVLDECFLVSDLKVIQGPNGEFKDVAHPLNRETRERMEKRILEEYEKVKLEPAPSRPMSGLESAAAAESSTGAEKSEATG